jgi:hypothetical protein
MNRAARFIIVQFALRQSDSWQIPWQIYNWKGPLRLHKPSTIAHVAPNRATI